MATTEEIRSDLAELQRENVRLRVLGDHRRFAPDLVTLIDDAVARTARNTGPLLAIALNYGAQDEIAAAASVVQGQADEGTPVALIRGLPDYGSAGKATDLVRAKEQDLFR